MATKVTRECLNELPPKATHMGELEFPGRALQCAVLDDGRRVLSNRGFALALGHTGKAKEAKGAAENRSYQLPPFLGANNLKPFIPKGFAVPTIAYRPAQGGPLIDGYDADAIPDICKIYLDARRAGVLKSTQLPMADAAEILLVAFAKVGLPALIDEATGFQANRERDALQRMFNLYLRDSFAAWSLTFYPDFYKRLFALRGWKWNPENPACGPRHLAALTKDLIYERLAPGVLEELERRNPVVTNSEGNRGREAKHHQLLTEDVGRRELAEHLNFVMRLMRIYPDWHQFYRALERACPKPTSVGVQMDFGDLPEINFFGDAA